MTEKVYKAGIVGCADIAKVHVDAYNACERTELVAIADLDPERLESFGERHSISPELSFPDHKSMLREAGLDIVSVCTWHGSHAEITIDAAESGIKGIFCEKPMATCLGDAKEMVKAADGNGAKLIVEHFRRYEFPTNKARELVAGGAIGEPQFVALRSKAGLLNWGTHVIDQVRYILGDPETEWVIGQLQRKTDRYERREPIEDLYAGLICFSNGARLTLEADLPGPELAAGSNNPVICGTEGQITVSDRVVLLNGDGRREFTPDGDAPKGFQGHVDELIEWVEGERDDHRCSGRKAFYTVEIMMSIYESMRVKGVVRMPLTTRANPLKEMLDAGRLPVENPGKYDIRLPYWE